MDGLDSPQTPKGSLRKFLEQLSGAGKAIGVLTSGGDAQGAPPGPRVPGPGRGLREGTNEKGCGGAGEKGWGCRVEGTPEKG